MREMPNRILKESICTSEKLAELSDFNFRLWAYLITSVDDYGRGDARPAIIKGRCFPLRDAITKAQIAGGMNDLAATGCIRLYEANGSQYFYFPNWERHQTIRNKKSKFPDPPADEAGHLKAIEINCEQAQADVPVIQSNTNTNPNTNTNQNQNTDGGIYTLKDREDLTAAAVKPDALAIYASNNLAYLSPTNMDELLSFRDTLTDEMIRYAIDEACGAGKRTYNYTKSILNRMVERGFKSLGEVKAAEEERKKQQAAQATPQAQAAQRTRKPMDERPVTDEEFAFDYWELMNRPRSSQA